MVFVELYSGVPKDSVRFTDLDQIVGQGDQQNGRLRFTMS
jgi:hypothetical protein